VAESEKCPPSWGTGEFFQWLSDTGCYVCPDTASDPLPREMFSTNLQPTQGHRGRVLPSRARVADDLVRSRRGTAPDIRRDHCAAQVRIEAVTQANAENLATFRFDSTHSIPGVAKAMLPLTSCDLPLAAGHRRLLLAR